MSEITIDNVIGDPKLLDSDLQKFNKDTVLLSSTKANLIAKYPQRWIAIYDGKVRADARSLPQVLAALDKLNIPRERVVVRLIDRNVRRMIL